MENNKIGINIKNLRQIRGLSQDRLSKLADISYDSVIKLENHKITNPTILTLQKIANTLGVSIIELLN